MIKILAENEFPYPYEVNYFFKVIMMDFDGVYCTYCRRYNCGISLMYDRSRGLVCMHCGLNMTK